MVKTETGLNSCSLRQNVVRGRPKVEHKLIGLCSCELNVWDILSAMQSTEFLFLLDLSCQATLLWWLHFEKGMRESRRISRKGGHWEILKKLDLDKKEYKIWNVIEFRHMEVCYKK